MKGIPQYLHILSKRTLDISCILSFILLVSNANGQATMYYKDVNITLKGGIEITILGDGSSKGDIVQDATGTITTTDNATIKLEGSIFQNSSDTDMFASGDRTSIVFINPTTSIVKSINDQGTIGNVKFHELTLEDGSVVDLNTDIWIYDNLNLQNGNVQANSNNIFFELDPTGNAMAGRFFGDGDFYPSLNLENDLNRVIEGNLFVKGTIGPGFASSPFDYGGLGLELTSSGLTNLDLKRSFSSQAITPTKSSIMRWFDVQSSTPIFGGNDIGFSFLNVDIPSGVDVNDLVFFRHGLDGSNNINTEANLDGGDWTNQGITLVSANTMKLNEIDTVYANRWTLADCQSPNIAVSSNSTDTVCVDDIVTLDAGNQSGWTYLWNTGETTQTIDVTNASTTTETFIVHVTNAELCFASDSIKVTWENYPVVTFSEDTVSVCSGSNYTLEPTTSGTNLSYLWSTGETTPTITHTSDGTQSILYIVSVTNPAGCQRTDSLFIQDFPEVLLDLGPDTTECNLGVVSLNAEDPGNANPITYNWSNAATTPSINVVMSDIYSVTVSDTETGCIATDQIVVNISDINAVVDSVKHLTCFEGFSGAIYTTITSSTLSLDIDWSDGSDVEDITFIPAGTYSVTATDSYGCQDSIVNIVINQPTEIVANPVIIGDTCGLKQGSIISNVSGGTPGYMYEWAFMQSLLPNPNLPDQTNLGAGSYDLSIIDANGCYQYIGISLPGAMDSLEVFEVVTDESCDGESNGSIDITVVGGNFGYSYSWSNGETSEDLSNLSTGAYTVTVEDLENCSLEKTFVVTAPAAPSVTIENVEDAVCPNDNGAIDLTINDIGSNFVGILWSNGATTEDLSGLEAGTYDYTITYSSNNCTISGSIDVGFLGEIILDPVVNDDLCNDVMGSIFTNASGGSGPLMYAWDDGATSANRIDIPKGSYNVTVSDGTGCEETAMFEVLSPDTLEIMPTTEDITCFGSNNGSITLNAEGGTPTLSFNWSNGLDMDAISGLSAGMYSVTVSDSNLCSVAASFTLTEPSDISISETIDDLDCFEDDSGSISLAVSGGNGSFTYLWSNGLTNAMIINLAAGTYDVTITDGEGCSKIESYMVAEPPLLSAAPIVTNDNCNDMGGSIISNPAGGTPPYSFLWSNGATTQDISGLGAGMYALQLTDANMCVFDTTLTISSPPLFMVDGAVTDVLCNGSSTGSIDLIVSGGNMGYTYNWSNGESTQDLSNIAAGNYSVTVTDLLSCTKTATFTIAQPAELSVVESITNVACNGDATGAIDLDISGGTPGYSFAWDNGETTEDLSNLIEGSYSVTVSDMNGCAFEMAYIVSENSALADNPVVEPDNCLDNMGSITSNISGGVPGYTYNWSNGASSADITSLPKGQYSLTVTDLLGCTLENSYTIDGPAAPVSGTAIITNIDCNGAATGSIDITPAGGTPGYSFNWSNGSQTEDLIDLITGTYTITISDANDCAYVEEYEVTEQSLIVVTGIPTDPSGNGTNDGNIDISVNGGVLPYSFNWSNGEITEDISGLGGGVFTVTVTDDLGCTIVESFILEEPSPIDITGIITDVLCNGDLSGAIDITPSGGILPYTYAWNNGANSEDIQDIPAGFYTVTVTDFNGITSIASFEVIEPDALVVNAIVEPVSCFGFDDGLVDLTPVGGTLPYTYVWSNGTSDSKILDVGPGMYSVTLTDSNDCTTELSYEIFEPDPLAIFDIVENPSAPDAEDGSISIAVTGGTEPYMYEWSNGDNSAVIVNLASGIFNVTIMDSRGCIIENAYELIDPMDFSVSGESSDVSCFGANDGSINITVINGSGDYIYEWSNGDNLEDIFGLGSGEFTVTVTDNVSGEIETATFNIEEPEEIILSAEMDNIFCFGQGNGSIDLSVVGGEEPFSYIWNNGESSEDLAGLDPGNYLVTVTDIGGCNAIGEYMVSGPDSLEVSGVVMDASASDAFDGSIDLTVMGGTAPYSYEWMPNGQITEDIDNLGVGEYSVIVTDMNGCTDMASFIIAGPSLILIELEVSNVSCNEGENGSISASASGGEEPYTFLWSNGEITSTISDLTPGTYEVTVTDSEGSSGIESTEVSEPDPIMDNAVVTDISCFGLTNGQIVVTPSNGIEPYSLLWEDGSTENNLQDLGLGIYSLTITDANDCEAIFTYEVIEPEILTVQGLVTGVSMVGEADGAIDLSVNGGTSPYSYQWENGTMTEDRSGLAVGTYSVTVTDDNDCTEEANYNVENPGTFIANANIGDVSCFGDTDGSIDLEIQGGVEPYMYNWSNGETTQDISDLEPAIYTVTVTDAEGTEEEFSYEVLEPELLTISDGEINHVTCFGSENGQIDVMISGGTVDYSYDWSNGEVSEDLMFVEPGMYGLTVTDMNGCIAENSFEVLEPEELAATAEIVNVPCDGSAIGMIDLMVEGGTMPYNYVWNTGNISEDLSNLDEGTYAVTITDDNNCLLFANFEVDTNASFGIDDEVTHVSCFNTGDGSIALTLTDAVDPVSYSWSNGQSGSTATNLEDGNYSVTVTDGSGCNVIRNYTITQPEILNVSLVSVNSGCMTGSGGQIFTNVTGGEMPYSYAWSNGSTSEDVSDLALGSYGITVSDNKGCTVSLSANILESPEEFVVRFLARSPVNFDETIEFVDVSFPMPNSWEWDFGDDIGSSLEEDPEYAYPNDPFMPISYYPVTLTATTPFCVGVTTKEIQVFNGKLIGSGEEEPEIKYTKIESLNVYPNPTNSFVNIDVILNQEDLTYIDVFDMEGRRVNTFKVEGNSIYSKRLQVDRLRTGLYVVLVRSGKDRKASKLVVID